MASHSTAHDEYLIGKDELSVRELWDELHNEPRIVQLLSTLSVGTSADESIPRLATTLLDELKEQAEKDRSETVAETVQACPRFLTFLKDAEVLGKAVASAETKLLDFQQKLDTITDKIRNYQEAAQTLQRSHHKKAQLRDLLSAYVHQILLTPDLVKHICEAPLDKTYLEQVAVLNKKLERAKQPGVLEHPSARESVPELQKLRGTAIKRLRDHLITRIEALKSPQTNIQILQQSLLAKDFALYEFLREQHPQSVTNIRQHYVAIMRTVYFSRFRTYLQALSRLQVERCAQEYLGDIPSSDSLFQSTARGAVTAFLSLTRSQEPVMTSMSTPTASCFSLSNRDAILQHLDDDPMLSTPSAPPETSAGVTFPVRDQAVAADPRTERLSSGSTTRHPPVVSSEGRPFEQAASAISKNCAAALDVPPPPPPPPPPGQTVSSSPAAAKHSDSPLTVKKQFPETHFRSHQKLLLDAATAEYFFLLQFFCSEGSAAPKRDTAAPSVPIEEVWLGAQCRVQRRSDVTTSATNTSSAQQLFDQVMSKTLDYLIQQLESCLANCFDCIGMFLMVLINDFNRVTVRQRKLLCVDKYLDQVQMTIWPRLKVVLDQNVQSLHKVNPPEVIQPLPPSQLTHPHYICRRYADFSYALLLLDQHAVTARLRSMHGIEPALKTMQSAMETLIQKMAVQVGHLDTENTPFPLKKTLFLINNYDHIGSVYREQHLHWNGGAGLESLLQDQINAYVEAQLASKFSFLIDFVQKTEALALAAGPPSSSSSSSSSQAQPATAVRPCDAEVVVQMERVAQAFTRIWSDTIKGYHGAVVTSFTHLSTGMDILKQILTQLLVLYTKYQRLVKRVFPSQIERQAIPWIRQLTDTHTIIAEIKTYSKSL